VEGFAPGTLDALRAYGWPGNVRELEHAIERAVALARSSLLLPEDLPADVRAETKHAPELPPNRMTLEELKRWYVALVLDEAGGNKVRAAELLGIDRRAASSSASRASKNNVNAQVRPCAHLLSFCRILRSSLPSQTALGWSCWFGHRTLYGCPLMLLSVPAFSMNSSESVMRPFSTK